MRSVAVLLFTKLIEKCRACTDDYDSFLPKVATKMYRKLNLYTKKVETLLSLLARILVIVLDYSALTVGDAIHQFLKKRFLVLNGTVTVTKTEMGSIMNKSFDDNDLGRPGHEKISDYLGSRIRDKNKLNGLDR